MASVAVSGHKRKHQGDSAADGPRKKKAAKSGGNNVPVTFRAVEEDAYGPVLALTPGLALPPKASFKAYRKARSSSKSSAASELLLHSADHPRINYTASEKQIAASDSAQKHYLAVYDPQGGTVELVEARTLAVKSSLRIEDEEMQQQKERQQQSLALQRQALGQEFGTKKARKAINSVIENAVSTFAERGTSAAEIAAKIKRDPGAAALMESMDTSAADAPTREAMQAAIDNAKPRPKCNLQADRPEEVYTLDSVCDPAMLRALKVKSWMDAIEDNEDVTVSSRYVAKMLPEIAPRDQEDTIKRVKALRFILLCFDFWKATKPMKGGGRKLPKPDQLLAACNADSDVLDMLKKRFTSKEHRDVMTKWQVDNLFSHMCAAALLIEDLAMDIFDLQEDLQLNTVTMAKYFAELGARVRSMSEVERSRAKLSKAQASVHRIAELKLPLEFPKQRVVPVSRKRR